MLKWVVILLLAIFAVRYFVRKKKDPVRRKGLPDPEPLRQDPVCGRYVPEVQGLWLKADGQRYHFCSRECMTIFKERLR